jgi:hypothetical protein
LPITSTKTEASVSFFKKISAMLGGGPKPIDDMARAYPETAMPVRGSFAAFPAKDFLGAQGVFAYRLQFTVTEEDANRVASTVRSVFHVLDAGTFQQGQAVHGDQAIHYSVRREFGGAVVELVTNSIPFLEMLDALHLQPPPPWVVFPDVDAASLGNLQGDMQYWWDWFWVPFWSAADEGERVRYLKKYPPGRGWLEYLELRF